jgi:hypothetical protein
MHRHTLVKSLHFAWTVLPRHQCHGRETSGAAGIGNTIRNLGKCAHCLRIYALA